MVTMMVVMVMKTMMMDRAGVTMLIMMMVMMKTMMMDRAAVMGDHLAAAPRANCCGAGDSLLLFFSKIIIS